MRRFLRRIPGLPRAYRLAKLLAETAYWQWLVDLRRVNEQSHLRKEWDYVNPYIRERNEKILAAVARFCPDSMWGDVLEIGCAEGHFTQLLARRSRSILAYDISKLACARAMERCGNLHNVLVKQMDIMSDKIDGSYDLIFAMDVLDFVHGRNRLSRVLANASAALRPHGFLVVSATRLPPDVRGAWLVEHFALGGDSILDTIDGQFELWRVHQELQPEAGRSVPEYCDHVIALFEKKPPRGV